MFIRVHPWLKVGLKLKSILREARQLWRDYQTGEVAKFEAEATSSGRNSVSTISSTFVSAKQARDNFVSGALEVTRTSRRIDFMVPRGSAVTCGFG